MAGIESQPRTSRCATRRALVDVDVPLGEPLQDLLERDAALDAGEGRAEAVVGAVAEREVPAESPVDVEAIGFVEVPLVAVRRGDHEQHRAAGGHVCPWILDVVGDLPGDVGPGRLEAQQLLDRVGDQRPVLDDLLALVGVLGQHLAHPPEQPPGRLDAGAGDHGR